MQSFSSANKSHPLRVCVLGCTGSIGTQTLDVCRKHADKLSVVALSAATKTDALVRYAREFDVHHVVVADPTHADDPVLQELPATCELGVGAEALAELCHLDEVDVVVDAVVGEAGIYAAYEALLAKKRLAIANKEALVSGGDLLMPLAAPDQLIPVDSEHAAIFQCLRGEKHAELAKIWLTCSGGPFRGKKSAELADVTPEQALAHPSWTMGPKITIDCATLMNKGLEVLEAHHLFDVPIDDVNVLVHPQSRIHSMVEFCDGSTIAQLGPSDMRIPIQFALSYPERWAKPCEPVNFWEQGSLSFEAPDTQTFRCLELACEAGRVGGTIPCAMNAANEVANAAFRSRRLSFLGIAHVVEAVMNKTTRETVASIQQLKEVDALARERATRIVQEVGL